MKARSYKSGISVSVPLLCHGNFAPHLHLAAYFTQHQVNSLLTVDEIPAIRDVVVPDGWFSSVRPTNSKTHHNQNHDHLPYQTPFTPVDHPGPVDETQPLSDSFAGLLLVPQFSERLKSPPDNHSRSPIYDLLWNPPSVGVKFTSPSDFTSLSPLNHSPAIWRQLPSLNDHDPIMYRRREPIDKQFLRRFSGCPSSES